MGAVSLQDGLPLLRGTEELQVVSEDSLEGAAFLQVTAQRLTSAHPVSRWHLQGWVGRGSSHPAHRVLGAAPRPLLDTPVTHPPHRPTLLLLFFFCPKEKINIGICST